MYAMPGSEKRRKLFLLHPAAFEVVIPAGAAAVVAALAAAEHAVAPSDGDAAESVGG